MNTLFLSLLVALYGANLTPAEPREVLIGETFSLALFEQVQVLDTATGYAATVTLNSLLDSRCPSDVLCIQAGEVTAQLAISENQGPRKQLRLSKQGGPKSAPADGPLAGLYPSVPLAQQYELVLLQALPYPEVKTEKSATTVQLQVRLISPSTQN